MGERIVKIIHRPNAQELNYMEIESANSNTIAIVPAVVFKLRQRCSV